MHYKTLLEDRLTRLDAESNRDAGALVKVLTELAWELREKDIGKSYEYSSRAYEMLHESGLDDSHREALCLCCMVNSLASKGDFAEVLQHGARGLSLCEEHDYSTFGIIILASLGWAWQYLGDYDKAFSYFERQRRAAEEIGDAGQQIRALSNLGVTFGMSGDLDNAIESLRKALEVNSGLDHNSECTLVWNNLAMAHMERGEQDLAMQGVENALDICRKMDSRFHLPIILDTKGSIHLMRNEYEQAEDEFRGAAEIARELGRYHVEAQCLYKIGVVKTRELLYEGAITYVENALVALQKCGAKSDRRLKTLTVVHRTTEAKKEADLHRLKTVELQNALDEVKTLAGLLPICANCKKIRNDDGYWQQVEVYIRDHSDAEFTHGICPDCITELYPDQKEWGLSLHIAFNGHSILFDAGTSGSFADNAKRLSVDFAHEIVMAIKDDGKLVIFTGCSHGGILNMIDTVAKEFEGVPIKAVVGGFHLVASPPFNSMAGSRREVEALGKSVMDYPVDMTYTGHCTGTKAF